MGLGQDCFHSYPVANPNCGHTDEGTSNILTPPCSLLCQVCWSAVSMRQMSVPTNKSLHRGGACCVSMGCSVTEVVDAGVQ